MRQLLGSGVTAMQSQEGRRTITLETECQVLLFQNSFMGKVYLQEVLPFASQSLPRREIRAQISRSFDECDSQSISRYGEIQGSSTSYRAQSALQYPINRPLY